MTSYRMYQLAAGHIVGAEHFEATNDEAALIYARSSLRVGAVEVWSGSRKVGSLSAAGTPDAKSADETPATEPD